MATLASVTEWVLAGQQTAVCKHHKGKHQSTRDFFIEFFVVCKHFLKTDPQRLSKVKKKMPFPSWVEGEGRIEVNPFFSQTRSHPLGVLREDHFLEVSAEGCPVLSGVPSSALSSVRGASSQEQGLAVPVWFGRSQSRFISLRVAAPSHGGSSLCPPETRLIGWGIWFSPGRPIGSQRSWRRHSGPALWSWDPAPLPQSPSLGIRF